MIDIKMTGLHLSQKEIYFDQQLDSMNPHYNVGTYITINGNLNVELLKKSINSSAQVFDIFRFKNFSNSSASVYLQQFASGIHITELDYTTADWPEAAVKQWLQERINKPFDIYTGNIYDFVLIKRKEDEYWFYMGCHHLFSDGYGVPYVFLAYVFDKYHALRMGEERIFQYPSYLNLMEKSNDYLDSGSYESDKNYWKERFHAPQEPILQKRSTANSFHTDTTQLFFNPEEQKKLRAFCLKNDLSLQDFLIAVLTVYYKKASGVTFFDFSLPLHNRNDRKERQTFGVFSKLIPCRIETGNPTLSELFKSIKTNQRQDYRHKQFPISHFNRMIQMDSSNSSSPFDICVNYRYFKLNTTETELQLKGFRNDATFSKRPIEFSWSDFSEKGKEEVFLEIIFREDYFDKKEVELLGQRILFIIDQFYNAIDEHIDTIQILPEQERKQLLLAFNDTAVVYAHNKTIIDLFEEQVKRTPDHLAVVFEEKELTYRELHESANQFARYLQKNYAIGADDLIGIKLERSEWMIIAILGVLKSGGAYVPIDPAYPQERIDYIEMDTKCKVCIDSTELNNFKKLQKLYSGKAINKTTSHAIAYVIYTSGSTGKPKGVLIEHKSAYSFIKWSHDEFEKSDVDTVLFTTSLNFDLSVFEIFYTLTKGKVLKVLKDGLAIPKNLEKGKKQLINTVPSVVGSLLQQGMNFDSVSVLNMAGEPIPLNYKNALKGKVKEIRNLYGPSEDTTYSTFIRIDKDERELIGKPISNTQIYILNENRDLQPIGVIGEICISGDGLARGYLNQQELTNEKFIANPFKAGARLYKTGDLGRWLPDGNIELAGRKDHQVKIRGYRIELGEIEHALQNHPAIEATVVLAKENQNKEKELVAYIAAKSKQNMSELRAYLKESLPDYMLPSYYVQLEALPLTPNGKINKKSLPDPLAIGSDGSGLSTGVEYTAPRNEQEEQLVKIWEEILQRENIGVKDDFFELGGHSLKATKLISEYHQSLDVKLTLHQVFNHHTIESHCQLLTNSLKEKFIQIEKVTDQESYPISDAQRRLWVLSQVEGGSVAYNMPGSLKLNGNYELNLFQRSFNNLIARHEILRTVFRTDKTGELRQWILDAEDLGFTVDHKDLRSEKNKEQKVKQFIAADSYQPFDLENGPLFRACLLQLEDELCILYFNMHHIISDGWSMEVLKKDLFSCYEAYKENKEPLLKQLRIQYKDYSAWASAKLGEESFKVHRSYWLEHLSGELPVLDLPSGKQRPRIKTNNGHGLSTYIDAATSNKLKRYSEEQGGSLFMGLLATWNILMYRYTGQKDIITGSPVAGRAHADLEDQIGFYVNTLALRNEIKPEDSFKTFYNALKDNTLKSYDHQLYPFDRLVEELDLQRDTSRSAVFDVMVTLQNNGEGSAATAPQAVELTRIADLGFMAAKFDLELTVQEMRDHLSLQVVYNTDVYEQEMIEGLLHHYQQLLKVLLENPSEKIAKVDFLTKQEKQELLIAFNDTHVDYPNNKTIIELFEEQVAKTPDHIAVIFEEKALSYRELHEQSNQFAAYLQKNYSVKPDDLVGIKLERSEWVIISILAVLKSGGAYVPIDPGYPQDRIDYIEKDTTCKVCIDSTELNTFRKDQKSYSKKKITAGTKAGDLAYVIYTSGSTGKPKGVMIEQKSVVRLVKNVNFYSFSSSDKLLCTGALSFDATTYEYWGPLLNGGQLIICSQGILLDNKLLKEEIKNRSVNFMWVTSGWLNQLVESEITIFGELQTIITGGDKLSFIHAEKLRRSYPALNIIHAYGPTENTTFSTTYPMIAVSTNTPIGKPISNTQVYIVSEAGELQPKGVTGEICLGGDGLARGYLNQETLTKEKFVANAFKAGERIYKTGDLGRWLSDGNIEFIGRKDNQVKIRGYRIELGEIEHALQSHKGIEAAVVLARENQNKEKELVAYIAARSVQNINELRAYLKAILPDYMLPAYYVQLQTLPLNSNGKIDKKSLPDPEGLGLSSGVEYIAPRNEREEQLVKVWEEILKRKDIGVNDDFFALGGHSLKAVRLSNAYQKELGVKIALKELFAHTSIASHAALIQTSNTTEYIAIKKVPVQESYPISYAQRRLWVLSQFEEGSVAYNIPGSLKLQGKYELELFQRSFEHLIERHEILRTVFKENGTGELRQWIVAKEEVSFRVGYQDFRKEKDKSKKVKDYIAADAYQPFDLERGPLLRVSLLQLEEECYVLYFNMHHIISDGWSMEILRRDVFSCYEAYRENRETPLSELNIQYKEYAAWTLAQLEEESFKAHRLYWLENLSGELPVLDLPSIKQRPRIKTSNGYALSTHLDGVITGKLKKYSEANGGSLFMGLLAAWNILMYRYTGQKDIITGSPIAGRMHADLEDQIGFYVNTLALRNEIRPDENFNELFSRIKHTTLHAYSHQLYPFDKLVEELALHRDASRSAVFDIMLILQNNGEKTARPDAYTVTIDPIDNRREAAGLNQIADLGPTTSKFDIDISFQEVGDHLSFHMVYNPDVYERDMIEGLMHHYRQLLTALLENPAEKIAQINYLSREEKYALLVGFNNTEVDYPKNKNIVNLFEEQAAKTPDQIAVVFEERKLTYRELNDRANQVAQYLQKNYSVEPGDLVGIHQERNEWMIVSILGVLKSGGAYVPLDPEHPQERINYMIADSGCKVVIDDQLVDTIKNADEKGSLPIDTKEQKINTPCAVIYTSGSTGKPKGIVISNSNLLNRLYWMWSEFPFAATEVCVAKTAIGFVDHLWEIFGPLLKGIRLVVFNKETILDTQKFIDQLSENRVSRIVLVPSLLRQILSFEKLCTDKLTHLKEWSCSGEVLDAALVEDFYAVFKTHRLLNIYGSTEVTADATYYDTSVLRKRNSEQVAVPVLFEEAISKRFNANLADAAKAESIIQSFDNQKNKFLQCTDIEKKGAEKYAEFVKDTLIKGLVDVSDPKFIGHMTSPVPPIMSELNKLMITWNQNLVKFETSGVGTLLERQCIGQLHDLVYKKDRSFYENFLQNASVSLGIVTSGGTLANFTALSYALSKCLQPKNNFQGLNKEGLVAASQAYGYSGIFIIGSQRCHYSFGKTLRALGLGDDAFISFEMDHQDPEKSKRALTKLITDKQSAGALIFAIIGVAGSTESGNVDPLTILASIASQFNIHFHVDAAFGGGYLFSEKLSHKLEGIQHGDSVTICGHKQLYLPLGLSVCLFKDESLALHRENTSKYQARKDSLDLGRYTIDGSRPFLSFVLHGALNIIGKEGYAEIIESNYERALLFKNLIRGNQSFELIESSDLNIVLYRYIPAAFSLIKRSRSFNESEQKEVNELNRQIQKKQFEAGKSFVSYTELKEDNGEHNLVVLRTVLMNPYTTKAHLEEILNEQEEIAADLLGIPLVRKNNVPDKTMVYVGRPISNTNIYILNEDHQLVPEKVTGEICIGGKCLSEGYLNNTELMKEKFIINPFNPQERIYKTGDLGRWTKDGNIEFIGRKDNQVKIRGYRIELGEIEQALQSHQAIEAAVVVVKENQNKEKELVAYITGKEEQHTSDLRSWLKEMLPEYMLPVYYVQLQALPLNANGKVDKKALPDPYGLGLTSGVAYIAPRNTKEAKLVEIWETVLQRERIGVEDDFFALGGHSLKAIRLISLIQKQLGVKLGIRNVFEEPSIAKLARLIETKHKEIVVEIPSVRSDSGYALSSSQVRMWTLSQHEDGNIAYNNSGTLSLEGDLNFEALDFAFNALMERHEILRTFFAADTAGEIKQFIREANAVEFKITYKDLRGSEDQKTILNESLKADSAVPFDLHIGPLFKAMIYQTGTSKWIFNLVVHHIICDGWSIKIMTNELLSFYNAFISKENFSPNPLRIQYKDYAAWEQQQLNDGALNAHKEYWLDQFKGALPTLNLKGSKPRPFIKTYNGKQIKKRLDEECCKKLRFIQQQQDATLFMSLLSIVTILLLKKTNQHDFIIGSPIAGRQHIDLEDQLGCYLNIIPLRTKLNAEDNFLRVLETVKQLTLNAYEHQAFPFEELVKELKLKRDMSRNVLFDVLVVLQNTGTDSAKSFDSIKGLKVNEYEKENNASVLDLSFDFLEVDEELEVTLEYNTDLFDASYATHLIEELEQLILFIVEHPTVHISQINTSGTNGEKEILTLTDTQIPGAPKVKKRTLIDDL
jgi:putative pyridoxal-dependent aspartate 1-decarboxylase